MMSSSAPSSADTLMPPIKRRRGRPSKTSAPQIKAKAVLGGQPSSAPLGADTIMPPMKRGRGRPPKTSVSQVKTNAVLGGQSKSCDSSTKKQNPSPPAASFTYQGSEEMDIIVGDGDISNRANVELPQTVNIETTDPSHICPECPVFRPTVEEFADPIKYLNSIRKEAEHAGICRIVPPPTWRPPFVFHHKKLRFRTKVQHLNELGAEARVEGEFVNRLRRFLYKRGSPIDSFPKVNGRSLNVWRAYKAVQELGGYDNVTEKKLWPTVLMALHSDSETQKLSGKTMSVVSGQLRGHYQRILLPFELFEQGESEVQTQDILQSLSTALKTESVNAQIGEEAGASITTLRPGVAAKNGSAVPERNEDDTVLEDQKQLQNSEHSDLQDSRKRKALPSSSEEAVIRAPRRSRKMTLKFETLADTFSPGESIIAQTPAGEKNGVILVVRSASATCDIQLDSEEILSHVHISKLRHLPREDVSVSQTLGKRGKKMFSDSSGPNGVYPEGEARLAPVPVVGQQFYRYIEHEKTDGTLDEECLWATVKNVARDNSKITLSYKDAPDEVLSYNDAQILLANGSSRDTAHGLSKGFDVCQVCLRVDFESKMLLCDDCDGGYHTFCLNPPLKAIPEGNWYCPECVEDDDDQKEFGFPEGHAHTLVDFKRKSDALIENYLGRTSELTDDAFMEKLYWGIISKPKHEQDIVVEYGNDLDTATVGSGFPVLSRMGEDAILIQELAKDLGSKRALTPKDVEELVQEIKKTCLALPADKSHSEEELKSCVQKYASDGWNLNNLPTLKGSLLQYLGEDIEGVMVPWLYIGMCFSSFCWHFEDHSFYSINYLHWGAPKIWYGVPGEAADAFDAVVQSAAPQLFAEQPDLLLQLVTMYPPTELMAKGVPVYRTTQHPGEFVVTFPKAYHGGYNQGLNFAEAVNFALADWFPWGDAAVQHYKRFSKTPIYAHDALILAVSEAVTSKPPKESADTAVHLLPALEAAVSTHMLFLEKAMDAGISKVEDFTFLETSVVAATVSKRKSRRQASPPGDASSPAKILSPARNARMLKMPRSMRLSRMGNSAVSVGQVGMRKTQMSRSSRMGNSAVSIGQNGMRKTQVSRSRMKATVSWAGRAGAKRGIQCFQCKQYCYLGAVCCTRCKFKCACMEHFHQLCTCEKESNYIFLYRKRPEYLQNILHRVRQISECYEGWKKRANDILIALSSCGERKGETEFNMQGISKKELEDIVRQGEAMLVDVGRLQPLHNHLKEVKSWTENFYKLFPRNKFSTRKRDTAVSAGLEELHQLIKEGYCLKVEPPELGVAVMTRDRLTNWVAMASNAIARAEANLASDEKLDFAHELNAIGSLIESYEGIECFVCLPERIRLEEIKEDLEWMRKARDLIDQTRSSKVRLLAIMSWHMQWLTQGPQIVEEKSPVLTGRQLIQVASPGNRSSAEFATLQQWIQITMEVEESIAVALNNDCSYSTCQGLEQSMQDAPLLPSNYRLLQRQISKLNAWMDHAKSLQSGKPSIDDVLIAIQDAGKVGISPTESTLRHLNQVSRDYHRWLSDLSTTLFGLKGSPRDFIMTNLEDALESARTIKEAKSLTALVDMGHPLLNQLAPGCICQQPRLDESASILTCCKCRKWFHNVCVETYGPSKSSKYVCHICQRHDSTNIVVESRACTPPIGIDRRYCVCRRKESDKDKSCYSKWIECDFCHEWFHPKCVGFKGSKTPDLDSFRCISCCFTAGRIYPYYCNLGLDLDRCLLKSVTIKKVRSLIATGSLIAASTSELATLEEILQIASAIVADAVKEIMILRDKSIQVEDFHELEFALSRINLLPIQTDGIEQIQRDALYAKAEILCKKIASGHKPKMSKAIEVVSDFSKRGLLLESYSALTQAISTSRHWLMEHSTNEDTGNSPSIQGNCYLARTALPLTIDIAT